VRFLFAHGFLRVRFVSLDSCVDRTGVGKQRTGTDACVGVAKLIARKNFAGVKELFYRQNSWDNDVDHQSA
jgi:hypothetical protein